MSPEIIGGLALAITGLISGIAGMLSSRSKDQREELEQLRSDYKIVRQQLRLADQWIFAFTRAMDQSGVKVPPPPEGLQVSGGHVDDSN